MHLLKFLACYVNHVICLVKLKLSLGFTILGDFPEKTEYFME